VHHDDAGSAAPGRRWTTRSPRRSTRPWSSSCCADGTSTPAKQARRAVAEFIDEYNTDRRHSTNGMHSPVDYERACAIQDATEQAMDGHSGKRPA
jgi:transposase InsO family protein